MPSAYPKQAAPVLNVSQRRESRSALDAVAAEEVFQVVPRRPVAGSASSGSGVKPYRLRSDSANRRSDLFRAVVSALCRPDSVTARFTFECTIRTRVYSSGKEIDTVKRVLTGNGRYCDSGLGCRCKRMPLVDIIAVCDPIHAGTHQWSCRPEASSQCNRICSSSVEHKVALSVEAPESRGCIASDVFKHFARPVQ
jgi:hypothetical protein